MKYMGSKASIAKDILPIILKDRMENQWYYEPFMGGCNSLDKVSGKRVGNDFNFYLASMWSSLTIGWIPPIDITREFYKEIKNNKDDYGADLVGWVGFGCSYSGKWFGGYAGMTNTKIGTVRNYMLESQKAVLKQAKLLKDVIFTSKSYDEMNFVENSIIYCDPPYEGTTKYKDDFDHVKFWNWSRKMVKLGHKVFVSEYNAPDDFVCVWEKEVKSSLSANGKYGSSKKSVERLFVPK